MSYHLAPETRSHLTLSSMVNVMLPVALVLGCLALTTTVSAAGVVSGMYSGSSAPPPVVAFREDFTSNTGLENFRFGVYHRNIGSQEYGRDKQVWGGSNAAHGGSWSADHDLACGPPGSHRTLSSAVDDFSVDELVYLCRDHVMTSMGDVDGYSIVWMSPDRVFAGGPGRTVAWDVNVTDLGARQWWEVSIVPTGTEFLATTHWLAGVANIGFYHPDAVVIGNGPFGRDVNISVDGANRYSGWQPVCRDWGLDPEGCASKMIRRTFSVTDNGNGALIVNYGGMFNQIVPGKLPDSFQVYFKDHNYTPDKDGVPLGHTWHWDNIIVD